MNDFDNSEFSAIKSRLRIEVNSIVDYHRSAGAPLTWRLIHEIEDEAFQRMQSAGDLDPTYIGMVKSSPLFRFPRNDEPVNFGKSNALPMAFVMIEQAYKQMH